MTATAAPAHLADAAELTDERAVAAMIAHHAELRRGLYEHVMRLCDPVRGGSGWEAPLASLTAYLATAVLPHAAAEEATLYPALSADPRGELFVEAMPLDHERLTEQTRALANACERYAALALAEAAAALFALHVTKENDLLLPALPHIEGVSVAELLGAMRDRLGEPEGQRRTPRSRRAPYNASDAARRDRPHTRLPP